MKEIYKELHLKYIVYVAVFNLANSSVNEFVFPLSDLLFNSDMTAA